MTADGSDGRAQEARAWINDSNAVVFFFSSRRRHTRCSRDWNSDVCSSDLLHATHTHEDAQDMRNMGGLARYMPWTAALMWIATLAIAGIPPFAGFFSKDEILGAAFAEAAV